MQETHSNSAGGFLPARIGNDLPEIILSEIDGEPRARDLDIAERLGYERPRVIRELIERNRTELETFGSLAVRHGKSRGQEFTEYWLTEEQALLVASRSDADNAPAVRRMLIKVFVAWRRGHLPIRRQSTEIRELASVFGACKQIARLAGFKGNQQVLSAAKATRKLTGSNPLELVDATHLLAEVQEQYLGPRQIGEREVPPISAQQINKALEAAGLQMEHRKKGRHAYWELTDAGRRAGGDYFDTGKKHGDGTPVKQIKWPASVIDLIRKHLTAA